MPTSYDDIPPDRRQQYLDKAEAAAREAHQKVGFAGGGFSFV